MSYGAPMPEFWTDDLEQDRMSGLSSDQCVIKGDGIYASIAAASILAKTYRDEYMRRLHYEFPHYGWFNNKGYGTAEHRRGIESHGLCPYHRKSFNILSNQLDIFANEQTITE